MHCRHLLNWIMNPERLGLWFFIPGSLYLEIPVHRSHGLKTMPVNNTRLNAHRRLPFVFAYNATFRMTMRFLIADIR